MLLVFISAGIDISAITMRDDKEEALYSELANKFPGTVKLQVVHNWFGKSKESTRRAGGFEAYPYKGINVRTCIKNYFNSL